MYIMSFLLLVNNLNATVTVMLSTVYYEAVAVDVAAMRLANSKKATRSPCINRTHHIACINKK